MIRKKNMKIKEYEAYKKHILRYMTIEDLKENLKHYTPEQLVRNRFFVSNYEVVLDIFEKIYGDEYCPHPYVTNDGLHLRFRKRRSVLLDCLCEQNDNGNQKASERINNRRSLGFKLRTRSC